MTVTQKAPRKAPAVTIRFRTKAELAQIKRAAKLNGQSLNTFVILQASSGAESVMKRTELAEQGIVTN